MVKLMGKKIITILRLQNFLILIPGPIRLSSGGHLACLGSYCLCNISRGHYGKEFMYYLSHTHGGMLSNGFI